MAGLRRLVKMFGGLKATTTDPVTGVTKTVEHVWDYAADESCLAEDMPVGSERWKASERVKWGRAAQGDAADGLR